MASIASASTLPLTMSMSSNFRTAGVRNQSLWPRYKIRKVGMVMYAARKLEAEKDPGNNTPNPFVIIRRMSRKSAKTVVHGCQGVLKGL